MYYCIWRSALVVLAVVVWSWIVNCVHCVKVTVLFRSVSSVYVKNSFSRTNIVCSRRINTLLCLGFMSQYKSFFDMRIYLTIATSYYTGFKRKEMQMDTLFTAINLSALTHIYITSCGMKTERLMEIRMKYFVYSLNFPCIKMKFPKTCPILILTLDIIIFTIRHFTPAKQFSILNRI